VKPAREEMFRQVERSLKDDIRPTLGDELKISAFRHMMASLVLTLGRGVGSTFYRAGFDIGVYKAEKHGLKGVDEALDYAVEVFEKTKLGLLNVEEVSEEEVVLTMKESVTADGYDVGEKLCYFQAGFIAGLLQGATGQRWQVKERACVAEGNEECVFVGRVWHDENTWKGGC